MILRLNRLRSRLQCPRRSFASGGTLPTARRDDDTIPAILSPCRYTLARPDETPAEAMNRLTEGNDL